MEINLRHVFDVDAAKDVTQEDEEQETRFIDSLLKWYDLNGTDDFTNLVNKLGSPLEYKTLPQVVLRKDFLIETLIGCLKADNMALDAALEMLSALACDLQSDFYPYFERILPILLNLISVHDPETLGRIFTCIAHLFRELKSLLTPHIKKIFKSYSVCLRCKNRKVVGIAAQVFGYLARHPSFESFIEMGLKRVKKEPQLTTGFGQVLFEVLLDDHGLIDDAHVFLKTVLQSYLSSSDFSHELLHSFLDGISRSSKYCSLKAHIWSFLKSKVSAELKIETGTKISSLTKELIELDKTLSLNATLACDIITKCCNFCPVEDTLDMSTTLLMTQHQHIPVSSVMKLVRAVFGNNDQMLKHKFVQRMTSYSMFSRDILPIFMEEVQRRARNCQTPEKDEQLKECIFTLSRVLLDVHQKLHLPTEVFRTLTEIVSRSSDYKLLWMTLKIIYESDFSNISEEGVRSLIHPKVNNLLSSLMSESNPSVLHFSVVELGVLCLFSYDASLVDKSVILNLIMKYPDRLPVMNIALRLESLLKGNPEIDTIVSSFLPNLSSPFKANRVATLEFLKCLASHPTHVLSKEKTNISMCLTAESIDVTPYEFRDKQQHLTQLSCIASSSSTSKLFRKIVLHYLLGSLYVNFTSLWKPIQQLLRECLQEDDKDLGLKNIFTDKVQQVYSLLNDKKRPQEDDLQVILKEIYHDFQVENQDRPDHVTYFVNVLQVMESEGELFESVNRALIPMFIELARNALDLESHILDDVDEVNEKSRDVEDKDSKVDEETEKPKIVVEEEHFLEEDDETDVDDDDDTEEEDDDEVIKLETIADDLQEEEPEINESVAENAPTSTEEKQLTEEEQEQEDLSLDNQDKWRLVTAFLKLLSRFKNPKTFFMSEEVESIYHELLKCPRPSVQEYTFHCLCNFHKQHLNPYKEHLLPFFKESSFKFALSNFVINDSIKDERVLKDQDRKYVMPILLKILVGRMKTKTAQKRLKSSSQDKRSLIMRYVAGCSDEEISYFLTLNFVQIQSNLALDYDELPNKTSWSNFHIRQMQSCLKTLESMVIFLGNLVSNTIIKQFLKILLVISSYTKSALNEKNKTIPHASARIKNLRSECIKCLIQFFKRFDAYPFNHEEVKCIFEVLVKPSMTSFLSDCSVNVSSILRLFYTWSENSRFFPILSYSNSDCFRLLPILFSVLKTRQAGISVKELVLNIIHNLLTLDNLTSSDSLMETDSASKSILTVIELPGCLSDGKVILQPFLSMIINVYAKRLKQLLSKKQRKRTVSQGLKSRDLQVLQSLSLIVKDSRDCFCLAEMVIQVFSRHYIPDHESTEEYSETIFKLVSRSGSQARKLIGSLAPLFLTVKESTVRMDLAKAVETIVKHSVLGQQTQNESEDKKEIPSSFGQVIQEEQANEKPENENVVLMLLSEAVRLLHECSYKRIDEPDFEARFQGFNQITQAFKHVCREDGDDEERSQDSEEKEEDKRHGKKKKKAQRRMSEEGDEEAKKERGAQEKEEEKEKEESVVKMTLDLLKITAYSCCFFLTQSSLDQSLRTCSFTLLEKMAYEFSRYFKKNPLFFNEVCISIVLKTGIRSGFKDTTEKTCFEFIGVLYSLMTHGKDKNSDLKQLSRLMTADKETDFWQNLRHIQVHRRARAFMRLASNDTLLQSLSQDVLLTYILPLADRYLLQESPSATEELSSASVELIGAVSKILEYNAYEALLRKYLKLLKSDSHAGQMSSLVKTISKILSNFNYDLSNASEEALFSRHESLSTTTGTKTASRTQETQDVDKTGHEATLNLFQEKKKDALNINEQEGEEVLKHSKEEDEEGGKRREGVIEENEETQNTTSLCITKKTGEEAGESDQTETKNGRKKLPPAKATFILGSIVKKLLPDLKKAVFDVTVSAESSAQGSKTSARDESDQVQRIPMMIAIVKLLLVIPAKFKILESNLTGILLRLCQFLKSRDPKIRNAARVSLRDIARDLGPSFLPVIFKEMKNTLTRGMLRHILSFSIHYLLVNLKKDIETGNLDHVYPLLLDIVFEDLTGEISRQKEVEKLQGKGKELRKNKSFDILHIMASLTGETAIISLFSRIKQELTDARCFRDIKRISQSLDVLVKGLCDNKSLSEKTLCTLIYGISQEQIEELKRQERETSSYPDKKKSQLRVKRDSLLIQDPEKKRKKKSLVSSVNHMLVMTEKALVLLHQLLKNHRLKNHSEEHLSLLDPFVVILLDSLSSKHVKLVCAGMRCLLILLMQFPSLPSLITHCNPIKNRLFVLLDENSVYSGSDGEHKTLIALSFRVISFLVASVSRVDITDDQAFVLLAHVDQELTLGGSKPSSFVLLSALIQRKVQHRKLEEIMRNVFEISIQSEIEEVRNQCIKVICSYLVLKQKQGRDLKGKLLFFVRQLEYETESGRLSAIRVISFIIKSLPAKSWEVYFNLLLFPLGCRMINEDSIRCKESIYQTLKDLLVTVNQEKRDKMFQQLILPWFQDSDFRKKILAMHVLSIFIDCECKLFLSARGLSILPLLIKSLRETSSLTSDQLTEEMHQLVFHQLTFLQQTLKSSEEELIQEKESSSGGKSKKKNNTNSMDILRQEVNEVRNVLKDFYLTFPHASVRSVTASVLEMFGTEVSNEEPVETKKRRRRRRTEEDEREASREEEEERDGVQTQQEIKKRRLQRKQERARDVSTSCLSPCSSSTSFLTS